MTTCRQIMDFMERNAPTTLAEEWDNVGLMVGNPEGAVSRVLLCVDVTAVTAEEAIEKRAELILSHHPLIFKGLKSINEQEPKGDLLFKLIRNGIHAYSAHTNLDHAENGVNAHLGNALLLQELEIYGKGPGRVGMLERAIPVPEFIRCVKESLDAASVRLIGPVDGMVQKVAVFSGSFDGEIEEALKAGADTLVTGDVKHHAALDAIEAGLRIIDAGHFNTEKIVLAALAKMIQEAFPEIDVLCSERESDPFISY